MAGFAFFLGLFLGCILMAAANYLDWKARAALSDAQEGRK